MVRTKVTPRKGDDRRGWRLRTQAQVHAEAQEPPMLVDLPVPEVETSPTQSELEKRGEEAERLGEVGRSPELSPTPTVGSDGCRGWAIYIRWEE